MALTAVERVMRYAQRHPERIAASYQSMKERGLLSAKTARYRKRHPERVKELQQRYDATREHSARSKAWRIKNPEKRLEYNAGNHHRACAQTAKRRSAKLEAIPSWADLAEIKRIYELGQIMGMDVDHIVPLISKNVCGLHTEDNLQLLLPTENRKKKNSWWPDMFVE